MNKNITKNIILTTTLLLLGTVLPQNQKPVLTLKEIDFRAREALIKNKILYNENRNKGKLKITGGGNNYTIDLSKRLHSDLANVYVKNPNKITVDVLFD